MRWVCCTLFLTALCELVTVAKLWDVERRLRSIERRIGRRGIGRRR